MKERGHYVVKTQLTKGTPEYLPPEIILSKGHNKSVDWWGVGIMTYEMLVGYPPFFDDTTFKIYEKILAAKIKFPNFIDLQAKDFIKKLLRADRSKRLGNLKNGTQDIKKHPWFKGVDWIALEKKQIDSPIIINVKNNGDIRYFGEQEDVQEDNSGPDLKKSEQLLFKDF
jgi:protein kinase X